MNEHEFNFALEEIRNLNLIVEKNSEINYIELSLEEIKSINNYFSVEPNNDDIVDWIRKKISNNKNRENFSCNKLSELYFIEKGMKLSKTKIYYILKNNLNFHYLKTSTKQIKLIKPDSLFMCLCFIKIIFRALILGYNILYMDESSILSKNNNYRCWRQRKESMYFNMKPASRSNLLLMISKNEIIHYQINQLSTTEDTFLEFISESINKIKDKKIDKFLIVLDNLSAHKTSKVINYFNDNKINIVFNCPYRSEFNCVELAFRYFKHFIYSKIYECLEDVEKDITELFEKNSLEKTLIKNYRETLEVYINYSLNHKYTNLNNLDYSK